jgi:hypothetical protein
MFVAPAWIEAHCVIPDGFRKGQPFRLYDDQARYIGRFYTVREDAEWKPASPLLAEAFVYRRGMLVAPQKAGKSPMTAGHVCLEGVGPALFAGWADKGDGYACADHGCACGWEYTYEPGEPMGMQWPTPLIQITANSEDQTDNIYDALRPMIEGGPLDGVIPKVGESFARLPNDGRIDIVTASDLSRLGQRTTFIAQTEVGLWTTPVMHRVARTQYRNLAGMRGRASIETNAWDPSQKSVAQVEYESAATDIYRQFTQPPKNLSFANKAERRRIFHIVYQRDSLVEHGGHVSLDAIDAEAADLMTKDPAEAARFFGNMLVSGQGRAFDLEVWTARAQSGPYVVPAKTLITLGFDGSRRDDHTALIGTEVVTGYQWPLGIWRPEDHGGEIPADLVSEVVEQAFTTWDVWRLYGDPPYWEDTLAAWAGRFGRDRVISWWTNRTKPMTYAYRAWYEAQVTGGMSHCAMTDPLCALFTTHVRNAFRHETGYRDEHGTLWYAEKERPGSADKIDSCPAAVLAWEARNDALAAGALRPAAPIVDRRMHAWGS